MRMIEADDLQAQLAGLALNADQFNGVDTVAVLWGVRSSVAAAGHVDDIAVIPDEPAQQNSAALVWVGSLPVAAQFIEMGLS